MGRSTEEQTEREIEREGLGHGEINRGTDREGDRERRIGTWGDQQRNRQRGR
jgi:hypothetical protein